MGPGTAFSSRAGRPRCADLGPVCPGDALAGQVEAFHQGGIGVYPDEVFIHVDVRGKKDRWVRVDGRYVGVEEVGLAG